MTAFPHRARTALRLVSGRYSPFLVPAWGTAERRAAGRWLTGPDGDPEPARAALRAAIESRLGTGLVCLLDSGRSAIELALRALGPGLDGNVILPSFSCLGIIEPVLRAGMEPVLVDVGADLNITVDAVKQSADSRTRAVIVPHLGGVWADALDPILDWASHRNVLVIEDAAQAEGLVVDSRPVGSSGHVSVFSTGLGKLLMGPGGGWLVVNDPAMAERVAAVPVAEPDPSMGRQRLQRFVRLYASTPATRGRTVVRSMVPGGGGAAGMGRDPADRAGTPGMSKIGGSDAELAALQLARVEALVGARHANASHWASLLSRWAPDVRTRPMERGVMTKFWVEFPGPTGPEQRRAFARHLWSHGLEVESLYRPLHLRASFGNARSGSLDTTEGLWDRVLSLPVRPSLSDRDWRRIHKALEGWARRQ